MGIQFLLPLIAGIIMISITAASVAPSFIEKNRSLKVENKLVSNQQIIFEAIKRYSILNHVVPSNVNDLLIRDYILDEHLDNGFGGRFEFNIDKSKGLVNITTSLSNELAINMFINSLRNTYVPVRDGNKLTTTFILPTNILHGNGQLNSEIPVGDSPPQDNTSRYWYDTSSGKATLMMSDGTFENGFKVWKKLSMGTDRSKIEEDKIYDSPQDFIDVVAEIGEVRYAYEPITKSLQEYVYIGGSEGWVSKSYVNGGVSKPRGCPNGFIFIPGSEGIGAFLPHDVPANISQINAPNGWCVMKFLPTIIEGTTPVIDTYGAFNWQDVYDMNMAIKVQSKTNSRPINYVSNVNAKSICSNHLIDYSGKKIDGIPLTYSVMKVLISNLSNNNMNWSGESKGVGYIYGGHNNNSPSKVLFSGSVDSNGYEGIGQSSGNQKRTLYTSEGEAIWDFSGNLWEQLYEGQGAYNDSNSWREYNNITKTNPFNPNVILNTTGNVWTSSHGIGQVFHDNGNANINSISVKRTSLLVRGGDWKSGVIQTGIFASDWSSPSLSFRSPSISVRCITPKK